MAKSSVAVFLGKFPHVKGVEEMQARIAQIPERIRAGLVAEMKAAGDDVVAKMKAVAPTAPEFERHPGELRDSIHTEPPAVELGIKIVADARDAGGHPYPAHVEYGHRTPQGKHAVAKPFFWPTWHVEKRKVRSRVSRAVRKAVAALAAGGHSQI